MIQITLTIIALSSAVSYLGYVCYKSITKKDSCASCAVYQLKQKQPPQNNSKNNTKSKKSYNKKGLPQQQTSFIFNGTMFEFCGSLSTSSKGNS